MIFTHLSEKSLSTIALQLASCLEKGDAVLLKGGLGVGKTTFARMIISSIMQEETVVPSPSFTLVQSYDTPRGELLHVDLYRLEHEEELYELGIIEQWDDVIMLVEWPEWVEPYCPKDYVICELDFENEHDSMLRLLRLKPYGNWEKKLKERMEIS